MSGKSASDSEERSKRNFVKARVKFEKSVDCLGRPFLGERQKSPVLNSGELNFKEFKESEKVLQSELEEANS